MTGKICDGDSSPYDGRDQRNLAEGHSCWGPTSSDALWWPCVGSRQNGRKSPVKFQPYFQWPWHHQVPGWDICGRGTNLCGNQGQQTWSCQGTGKCIFKASCFSYPVLIFCSTWRNCSHANATGLHYWEVNISSVIGFVTSGTKPFPELIWPRSTLPFGITCPQWVHIKIRFNGVRIIWIYYQQTYK